MKHFTLTLFIILTIKISAFTQVIGDFRSKSSGNWGDSSTWQIYNGTTWNNALAGQFPGGTNESNATTAYIEAAHTVTLEANHSCKNLHLNTTADVVRINTQNYTLDVWGKMRFYSGTAPGSSTPFPVTTSGVTGWITTGASGYIRFRGTADRIVMAQGQVNSNNTNSGWNLDFAFDNGFTGQINDRIRATNITVSSGTLFVNNPTGELRIGTNNGASDLSPNGAFIIKTGATAKGGAGIFKKSTVAAGSISIETGGNLIIDQTNYVLAAAALTLNGTVTLQNAITFPTEAGRSGASSVNTFTNLSLEGTGEKTLQNNITANGRLSLGGTASLTLNSYTLSYGSSGELEYNGTATQTTTSSEFPASGGPLNLIVNNSNGVSLHANRTINNQLTLSSGLLLLGNNDLTLGASSPAVAGTPSVSNMVVTDGTGKLIKIFNAQGSYLYPVGDTVGTDELSTVQITVNSANLLDGTTYMGIRAINAVHPASGTAVDRLSRYWEVSTNMSGYSYDGTFQYLLSDVNGNEANVNSFLFSDETTNASKTAINNVNSVSHQIGISNINTVGFISGANFGCNISNNSVTPPSTTVFCYGSSNIFFDGSLASVTSGSPSYQWQKSVNGGSWTNISLNGQSEDYTDTTTLSPGTYGYRRIVSDPSVCISASNITSNEITITVNPAVTGNSIGTNQTVPTGGDPAIFSATDSLAGGDGSYTYQWQLSSTQGGPYSNISGANGATYDSSAGISQTTYFIRNVSSASCTSISNEVIVTVCDAPVIIQQPTSKIICEGANTTFIASGTGTNLTYQWQESTNGGTTFSNLVNGGVYSNATSSNLTITGALASMSGYKYKCIISGSCSPSVTSNTVILTVNAPASVVTSPSNTSACTYSNVSFFATGAGSPVSYRWQVSTDGGATFLILSNDATYSNVTTNTLTISSVPSTYNNYQYRCRMIGSCSQVYTTAAILSVNNSVPGISSQPTSKIICEGANTTFSTFTTGTNLIYQWKESTDGGTTFSNLVNGGVYSNTDSSNFTITGAPVSMSGYKYKCLISGGCSALESNTVTLTVNAPASVVTSPSNTSACTYSNVSFFATGAGSPISYRWQVSTDGGATFSILSNDATYSNVTTNTLTISSVPSTYNNYQYRCRMIGSCSQVYTTAAILSINNNLTVISSQPTSKIICEGANATFSLAASGGNLSYQWQESTNGGTTFSNLANGGVYSNTTSSNLTITGAPASMSGYKYKCVISASCAPDLGSNNVTLTVNAPASVVTSPSNTSACVYTDVSFSATGAGTPISYRWQVSTDGGATFTILYNSGKYSNVTTPTLNITSVPGAYKNYQYRCRMTGSCSEVYTSSAILTVYSLGCGARLAAADTVENGEPISETINAYPNPFNDEITLLYNSLGDNFSVTVRDLDGRIVFINENHPSSEALVLGNELKPGVFIVEIRSETESKTLKIVKVQ